MWVEPHDGLCQAPSGKARLHSPSLSWAQPFGAVQRRAAGTRQGGLPLASPPGAVKNGKVADPAARTPNTSSLSQLGAYSDSEDSS